MMMNRKKKKVQKKGVIKRKPRIRICLKLEYKIRIFLKSV